MYNVANLYPLEQKPKLGVGSYLKCTATGGVYAIVRLIDYRVAVINIGSKFNRQGTTGSSPLVWDNALVSVEVENIYDFTYKEIQYLLGSDLSYWRLLTSKEEILVAIEACL